MGALKITSEADETKGQNINASPGKVYQGNIYILIYIGG